MSEPAVDIEAYSAAACMRSNVRSRLHHLHSSTGCLRARRPSRLGRTEQLLDELLSPNEYDQTTKIFSNPGDERTENYITGRFG